MALFDNIVKNDNWASISPTAAVQHKKWHSWALIRGLIWLSVLSAPLNMIFYWMSWLDETMTATEVLSYVLLDVLLFMPFVRLINKREPSVIAKYLRLSWLYWLIWVLLMVAWLLVDFQAVDARQVFIENAGTAFLIQIALTATMIWYANHSKTYRLQYCLQVPKQAV